VTKIGADLSHALRLLASGRGIDEVWVEAGYASCELLADDLMRLADSAGSPAGLEPRGGAGRAGVKSRGRGKAGLKVIAYSDGAAIGNPGRAGCGVVILDLSGQVLLEDCKYLGETTNNVAEYEGALLALARARELGANEIDLKVDSELLAKQIRGGYRVKSPNLAGLYSDLMQAAGHFKKFTVTQIGRSENKQADKLANLAIASRKR
jgi:ribonuclease HI